jgi:ribosomal-protein-alanine N-acetyltransferase
VIRPARDGDAAVIAALQSHLDAPSPQLLATVDAVGFCLVAVDGAGGPREVDRADPTAPPGIDGSPVGYVLVIGEGDTHLAELVVHPDHRREGHGRALVDAVIDRQPPGTRVTLAVAADNDPARSLYESAGFRAIDRRPEFYESVDGCTDEAVVYAYDVPEDDG